jgi:hypothetical protein
MTHHGHDRRTGLQFRGKILLAAEAHLNISFGNPP